MRSKTPLRSGQEEAQEQDVAWQLTVEELERKAQREALQLMGLSARPKSAKSTLQYDPSLTVGVIPTVAPPVTEPVVVLHATEKLPGSSTPSSPDPSNSHVYAI